MADRIDRVTPLLALTFAVAAAPVLWWQTGLRTDDRGFQLALALAGLLLAGLYVCVVLLLLRTPLGSVLRAVFAPLGRMALTNYLTATVLIVARLLGSSPETWSAVTVSLIAGAILAVQWAWSTLWLRGFHYGPLEWLWRWATWLRRPPLRRAGPTPRRVSAGG